MERKGVTFKSLFPEIFSVSKVAHFPLADLFFNRYMKDLLCCLRRLIISGILKIPAPLPKNAMLSYLSQASTRECSEGGSESSEELCPDVPVIEPDCQEKSKSDASLTPDTKSGGSESLEDFGIKLDKEKEEDEEEEDFVDEEYLKDLELSMTEEEKEVSIDFLL